MMQQGFGMQPQMMQGGPMGQMPMGQMQAPPGTMLPPPQAVTNQQQPGQAGGKKPKRRVLTSLALQVFIYFGAWWDVFYYVLNILVFVYKGVNLPYPKRNFDMEFSFSWLWILLEIPRLFLSSKGNKTERAGPIFFSLIPGGPVIAMYVYFIAFQTYVLKIDEILNAISLAFLGMQLLLSLLTVIRFFMATRYSSAS